MKLRSVLLIASLLVAAVPANAIPIKACGDPQKGDTCRAYVDGVYTMVQCTVRCPEKKESPTSDRNRFSRESAIRHSSPNSSSPYVRVDRNGSNCSYSANGAILNKSPC